MQFIYKTLAVSLSLLGVVSAHTAGFTLSSKNPDGSCRNTTQWAAAFAALQALPATSTTGNITSTRLFGASDCGALLAAAPAAIAAKQTLLVGIWSSHTNASYFTNETAALSQAITAYGDAWISGIAVGSEDLWRGMNNVTNLVSQINTTRNLVRSLGSQKPVGHVDDYTIWTNSANAALIKASDFIGVNIHPYYSTASISSANATFWTSLLAVQQSVAAVKNITLNTTTSTSPAVTKRALSAPQTPITALTAESLAAISQIVWVTETGWAVAGPKLGSSEASVESAAAYWKAVACGANNHSVPVYWPADTDSAMVASFGTFNTTGGNLFVAAC